MSPPTTTDEIIAMYDDYVAELSRIGTLEFELKPGVSRRLAHEVLGVAIAARGRIEHLQVWLAASMRAAAGQRRGA